MFVCLLEIILILAELNKKILFNCWFIDMIFWLCSLLYWSFYVHFRISFLNYLSIDVISHNKIATQSTTYNNNDASRAVDGNTATCMQTNSIGVGTNFHVKTVWWKVDLGGLYSIYSINIQFKNYDGYGLCFYICYMAHGINWSKVECYIKRLFYGLLNHYFWGQISPFKEA